MTLVSKLAVIGIGQELRGDDGAGLAIVRRWQKQYPHTARQVRVELLPLPGLDFLNVWDGVRAAIIVDVVLSDARPGSLHELGTGDLESFGAGAQSAHGWGLAESLALAENLGSEDQLPEIKILAIAGSAFKLGTGLSPAVIAALPRAAEHLEGMINGFLDEEAVFEQLPPVYVI